MPFPETAPQFPERLQQSDPEAWKQLVTEYGGTVRGHLSSWTRADDLDEMEQEFWLQLSKSLVGKPQSFESFRAWLIVVLRRFAIRWSMRQKKRIDRAAGGTDAQEAIHHLPDFRYSEERTEAAIERTLKKLSDREKIVFRLLLEGESRTDIATRIDVTPARISQIINQQIIPLLLSESQHE